MKKNKTFFESVKYAAEGLIKAYKEEKNFKIYTGLLIGFGIINFIIGIDTVYWMIYLMCGLIAFSAECFNTAIERICDFLTNEKDDRIKDIKDIAAGAVLYTGIIYFTIEGIIIYINL